MNISEIAKSVVLKLPPDILMHPMPFPDRLDYAEKIVQEALDESRKAALLSLAKELEEEKDAFVHENFAYDPETGCWEGSSDKEEWVAEREELIEEIRTKADQQS